MLKLVFFGLFVSIKAAPGYDFPGLGLGPIISAPAPIYSAFEKAQLLAPSPILAPAPVAPIIKTIAAPATSYATVTRFHIAHPAPIVKTILAPQPILKSYYPAPLALGHGYH